jgi:hypothetical protein
MQRSLQVLWGSGPGQDVPLGPTYAWRILSGPMNAPHLRRTVAIQLRRVR